MKGQARLPAGQALITLLFFMAIGITVATAAAVVSIVNAGATSTFQQGEEARIAAESGVENAIMRLLRDPNYSGETLTLGEATIVVQVTGSAQKTIRSEARSAYAVRTVVSDVQVGPVLRVTGWEETF